MTFTHIARTALGVGAVTIFFYGVFVSTAYNVAAKTNDHGQKCKAAIGNTLWYDNNANGIQESDEPGITNAKVKLYNGDRVQTQRTNTQGRYKFKNLCEGTYRVVVAQEKLPKNCVLTHDRDGKKDHQTEKYLKIDSYHTKADFGYMCGNNNNKKSPQTIGRTAPKTGSNSIIVALVSALTASAMFVATRRTKKKSII